LVGLFSSGFAVVSWLEIPLWAVNHQKRQIRDFHQPAARARKLFLDHASGYRRHAIAANLPALLIVAAVTWLLI